MNSKQIILSLLTFIMVSTFLFAQDNNNVQVKIVTSCNGNVTTTDTTYTFTGEGDLENILENLNISVPDCDFEGDINIDSILNEVMVTVDVNAEGIEIGDEDIQVIMMSEFSEEDMELKLDSILMNEGLMEYVIELKKHRGESDGEPKVIMKKMVIDGGDAEQQVIKIGDADVDIDIEEITKNIFVTEEDGNITVTINGEEIDLENCGDDIDVFHYETEDGKMVIATKICVFDITEEDKTMLSNSGITEEKGQLEIENFEFFPNPNDGKFELNFALENKGKTVVRVLDVKGKEVYKEVIDNFSGSYKKNIDISSHGKGTYFLHVQQGKRVMTKKMLIQ